MNLEAYGEFHVKKSRNWVSPKGITTTFQWTVKSQ